MLKILRAEASGSFKQGPFRIRRIRPGAILGHDTDPAFGLRFFVRLLGPPGRASGGFARRRLPCVRGPLRTGSDHKSSIRAECALGVSSVVAAAQRLPCQEWRASSRSLMEQREAGPQPRRFPCRQATLPRSYSRFQASFATFRTLSPAT